MIFNGWMWVALALTLKRITGRVTERIEARTGTA
jgi:hypothetical protein